MFEDNEHQVDMASLPGQMEKGLFLKNPNNQDRRVRVEYRDSQGEAKEANGVFKGFDSKEGVFLFDFGPQGIQRLGLEDVVDLKPADDPTD